MSDEADCWKTQQHTLLILAYPCPVKELAWLGKDQSGITAVLTMVALSTHCHVDIIRLPVIDFSLYNEHAVVLGPIWLAVGILSASIVAINSSIPLS